MSLEDPGGMKGSGRLGRRPYGWDTSSEMSVITHGSGKAQADIGNFVTSLN